MIRPMEKLIAREQIEIAARAERVWQVLTDPALTRRYMFGCEPITDWAPGSTLDWRGVLEGKPHVFVSGQVIRCEPPSVLEYTTFDPSAAEPDPPELRAQVKLQLHSPRAGLTRLEVSQGDFARLHDARRRYEETCAGWAAVVVEVKKLAESD
jgi:uncharacterized protein YndB with AHSA1/START domain